MEFYNPDEENEYEEDENMQERPEHEERIINETADLFLQFIQNQPSMPGLPDPLVFRKAFDSAICYVSMRMQEAHDEDSHELLMNHFKKMQRHIEN